MTASRLRSALFAGLLLALLAVALQGVQGEDELESVPSEDSCRPYIEKALKDLGTGSLEQTSAEVGTDDDDHDHDDDDDHADSHEEDTPPVIEETEESAAEPGEEVSAESAQQDSAEEKVEETTAEETDEKSDEETGNVEDEATDEVASIEDDQQADEPAESAETKEEEGDAKSDQDDTEEAKDKTEEEDTDGSTEKVEESAEKAADDGDSVEGGASEDDREKESKEDDVTEEGEAVESKEDESQDGDSKEGDSKEGDSKEGDSKEGDSKEEAETQEAEAEGESTETAEVASDEPEGGADSKEASVEETISIEEEAASVEEEETKDKTEEAGGASDEKASQESKEGEEKEETEEKKSEEETEEADTSVEGGADSKEETEEKEESKEEGAEKEEILSRGRRETSETVPTGDAQSESEEDAGSEAGESKEGDTEEEPTPEEDLIQEIEIPENLRPRDHIDQLLRLDVESEEKERAIEKVADVILKDLKRLYDNAIQPLETLYKYRDLSNRHFGDPEIFSKPLVLFMGPWSGGKSSIINYLLDIEYKRTSLRTGAEPSPAYFNILMYGEEEEILDGTQLAADWTFSGLQKFGQGMLDRLRGLKLNDKLLKKVNIVEIPGILEIRKQVQRLFPFNDACQWFIDRADIIFLVYDPSKLDVGPETEAILDQLKGREYQTRIILNKADQVKPEELMRVQGALIWNISPLMSSAEPPIMYSTSLWSMPYEAGAPTRLLYAQERAFLRDLRSAIDKRVEHKIASARRFAVRVRNHAKMVDCYLTTYYNHKTFFGNKKEISDKIIENPQDYHIYEGLSTLTNISRYDLPDPDVYRDFFRLNPLYDFQLLSSTCTYFRGCPINRLDVAIAYDLPELVGKYKKSVEAVMHENEPSS